MDTKPYLKIYVLTHEQCPYCIMFKNELLMYKEEIQNKFVFIDVSSIRVGPIIQGDLKLPIPIFFTITKSDTKKNKHLLSLTEIKKLFFIENNLK